MRKELTFRSYNGVTGCRRPVWQMIKPVQSIYQTELFHIRMSGEYCGYLAQRAVSLQSEFDYKLQDICILACTCKKYKIIISYKNI